MNKYIDAEKLFAFIDTKLKDLGLSGSVWIGRSILYELKDKIKSLQQEQESVAERFARIVRGNLTGIDEKAQSQFEQLYFEITGTKMYGGYND